MALSIPLNHPIIYRFCFARLRGRFPVAATFLFQGEEYVVGTLTNDDTYY